MSKSKTVIERFLDYVRGASPEEKSQFIDQVIKEKDLYDALKAAGLTITISDVQERARERSGVLTTVEKVNVVDQIAESRSIADKGAILGTDIDAYGTQNCSPDGEVMLIDYFVPTNKILLIYDWAIAVKYKVGYVFGYLFNSTYALHISLGAGAQGFQTPFSKPKRIESGEEVMLIGLHSGATTPQILHGHFGGILI